MQTNTFCTVLFHEYWMAEYNHVYSVFRLFDASTNTQIEKIETLPAKILTNDPFREQTVPNNHSDPIVKTNR